jgi:DNA-binding GntR family transcriptional regulator
VSRQERDELRSDHQEMLDAFIARDAERLKAAAQAHHQRLTACITLLSPEGF